MKETVDYKKWFDIANEDIKASRLLYNNGLYSQSFYLFQQSSEKVLKGLSFKIGVYKTIRDAQKTSHETMKLFRSSGVEQYEYFKFIEQNGMSDLLKLDKTDLSSKNILEFVNDLPSKDEIIEYQDKDVSDYLSLLDEIANAKVNFDEDFDINLPNHLKNTYAEMHKISPELAASFKDSLGEMKIIDISNITRQLLDFTVEFNYCMMSIFICTLITHNHNNFSRYPNVIDQSNPINYYNENNPMVKNQLRFIDHLEKSISKIENLNLSLDFPNLG